ncbi:MAG: UMP kinase [Candidatus Cloacimonetes bacterium]|nr:UMP kinase [Candidatus Cloacimonadota bacterium]
MKNYQRILLKLSGEVLQGQKSFGIDNTALTKIVKELIEIHNDGIEISIVIGGGNFFRGASAVASKMNRVQADNIGMLATIQNSIALKEKFNEFNTNSVIFTSCNIGNIGMIFNADKAKTSLKNGMIAIFGGGTGNPFFTTDTAAVLRALETDSEIVIKGTKVDGIFDKDPKKYKNAKFFITISFDEYIKRDLKVMDLTSISLAKEFHLPIKVFNIKESGNIKKAIYNNNFGSIINT